MKRLLILFAATATLAACGSATADDREVASLSTTAVGNATDDTGVVSEDATDTTAVTDPNEAALQFAKCMREQGIDMPDPQFSTDGGAVGGVLVQIGGPGDEPGERLDPKEMEAANKECQHFMEDAAAGFDPPSEEDLKKMQEDALEFSKCMRDHGIDMPDPQFSTDGGGFSISVGVGAEGDSQDAPVIDFDDDEFQAASEACGGPGGGFAVSAQPVDG